MTEQEIIEGLRVKNEDSFKTVYKKLYRQLCYFATNIVYDEEEAKDAVMDAFEKLWKKPKQFEGLRHLENYIYQAVKRNCQMYIRKTTVRTNYKGSVVKMGPPIDENAIELKYQESEIVVRLYEQIDRLPERMQQAFKLTYLEGHSRAEVAAIMQVSEHTVKNQLDKAKEIIRRAMTEKELLIASLLIYLHTNQQSL